MLIYEYLKKIIEYKLKNEKKKKNCEVCEQRNQNISSIGWTYFPTDQAGSYSKIKINNIFKKKLVKFEIILPVIHFWKKNMIFKK